MAVCLTFPWLSSGQQAQQFFRHITVEDGLSNNWVKSILKDKDGFMWFGTFNGLNRYDGHHFNVFQTGSGCNLSDNVIESMANDASGNIWAGTFSGGLNRFDRTTEKFTVFQHDPNDPSSISGNKIYTLFTDENGDFWIGTDAGLDLYDVAQSSFHHFIHDPHNAESISSGLVSSIFQDHIGQLWIGTEGGLNVFLRDQKKFRHYNHDPNNPNSLASNYVKSISEDKYGHIWLGTWGGGLDKYLSENNSFQHFQYDKSSSTGLSNNSVLSVASDNENQIYLGTEGGGLNTFNIQEEIFTQSIPDISDERSINSNSIHALYYDDDTGVLWAGTYNGGINYFSKWDKPFTLYQAKINGLNNNHVNAITEDRSGKLWIGTDGGGVNIIDESKGTFDYLRKKDGIKDGLQSNAILSLLCDSHNTIWIGSFEGGLDQIKNNSNSITHFTFNLNDNKSLSDKNVSDIYEDRRGNIWVGTMYGGLNLYHGQTNTFSHFKHDPANVKSIIDDFIYGIYEDRLGHLLVQTGKGLEVYDYQTGYFERYSASLTTDFGVPGTLLEDSEGNIWIGSQEKGLFRFDRSGTRVNRFTTSEGMPGNSISGILEDELGNLWISTQHGLCKLEGGVINPDKFKIHIFSAEDGLQGSEFKRGAFFKTKNGRMAFGGQKGFNVFDPLKIKYNPFVPPVKITSLKIFNKEVDFAKGVIINTPITETQSIRLNHNQSVLTFEFSALNYMLSGQNQYAYMLEGFENTWNYVGKQRNATYSNLDAGEYFFKVKASNNDGIWNDTGTHIKITVVPPWWESVYFRLALIVCFIAVVYAYYRYKTYQLKQSKKELEYRVALSIKDLTSAKEMIEDRQKEILRQNEILVDKNHELEIQSEEIKGMAEEIRELTKAKIKFFSNISKELHAPLNLILQQVEELIANHHTESDQLSDQHSLIYRNATELIRMITQLLDISRKEGDNEKINLRTREALDSGGFLNDADSTQYLYSFKEELEDLKENRLNVPSILIIEEDADSVLVKYQKLKSLYHIEIAMTSSDGLKMATEHIPDLILCDAHLPDGLGLDLCGILKNDDRTSHIPIILMTARNGEEIQSQGSGIIADDYITKPFQFDLLELKIKNIFFTRQKLKEMFLKSTLAMPEIIHISSVDKKFLKEAVSVVRLNLQNSNFGVDEFSEHFAMSRRNVLRKMKGVTGLSINEYIRNTRLKEAYNLLVRGELNVSEVAYSVGFTDPKYFSNCFKKQFGKLPSEVRTVPNPS